jgi:hypothetical protein
MTSPRERAAPFGHLALVFVTVAATGAAVVELAERLTERLVVPLQVADRYWADGVIFPGQVEGDGAPALETTVRVVVDDAPAWLRSATGAGEILGMLALALGAWALAGVVRSVGAGDPLASRNPVRLGTVAGAVVLGGLVAPLADTAARHAVLAHLAEPGQSAFAARQDLSFVPLLVAGMLVVVAGAFRRGAAVRAGRSDGAPVPN